MDLVTTPYPRDQHGWPKSSPNIEQTDGVGMSEEDKGGPFNSSKEVQKDDSCDIGGTLGGTL
jgi:hypothetical protein